MLSDVRRLVGLSESELKEEVILKSKDGIFFLLLNRKANSFNPQFMRRIHEALDKVEQHEGDTCLVTISLQKIFSGGIDLKHLMSVHPEDAKHTVLEFASFIGRFESLSVPTIAVVNKTAVAGGCILSFAHDYIYSTPKTMFLCNEVDLGTPAPSGIFEAVRKKHRKSSTYRDMMLFGQKFSEEQLLKEKIIDGVVGDLGAVVEKAEQLASFGYNKSNFKRIKAELNKGVIDASFNRQFQARSYFKMGPSPKL